MKKISFLLGIATTVPILAISLAGRSLTLYNFIYVIFNALLFWNILLKKEAVKIKKMSISMLVFLFLSVISCLMGYIYFSSTIWGNNSLSYLFNTMLYLITFILLIFTKEKRIIGINFINGFIFGAIINVIWAVLEGIAYYGFGKYLNNEVFSFMIPNVQRGYLTIVTEHGVRASGFNIDPAHLGALIPFLIGYAYFKKSYVLFFLSIIALVFSQSTTGLIASMFILAICIVFIKPKTVKQKTKKTNLKLVTIIMLTILITPIFVNKTTINMINKNLNGFIQRIETKKTENSDNKRVLYHINFPTVLYENGVGKFLTGSGIGTSGYGYVTNENIAAKMGNVENFAYDVESTYISYFIDLGIFGILIYIYMLVKIMNQSLKQQGEYNYIIFIGVITVFITGFFYHYIFTSYQILWLIFAVLLIEEKKNEKKIINNNSCL